MAFKSRNDLKDVFNGLSSLYFSSGSADLDGANNDGIPGSNSQTLAIDWEYELPVTVDTLQISQDDPTINHYKVIGLQGDWTSSAEAGEFTIQFTVPTKATEVIKLAFGEDSYKSIVGATMTGNDVVTKNGTSSAQWDGAAVTVNMHKVTGTIGLLNEEKTDMMIVSNIALYAKPMYENPGTEPFAIQFSGTIETSGDSNFAWLKKTTKA